MARRTQVILRGELFEADWENQELPALAEGILTKTGEAGVALMRGETRPYDYSKTLTNSIMWRTSKRSSVKQTEYEIDAPRDYSGGRWEVWIGSAAPHAEFREKGAGPHKSADGSAEFLEEMRGWFKAKIGMNPDDKGEGQHIFWAIIQSIRNGPDAMRNEQGRKPFAAPTRDKTHSTMLTIAEDVVRRELERLNKRYRT